MVRSKLGYHVWILVLYLLTTNLKGGGLQHETPQGSQGHIENAWHLSHRIRAAGTVREAPVVGIKEALYIFFVGENVAEDVSKYRMRQIIQGSQEP